MKNLSYLMLLSPSANRVYGGEAEKLAIAELSITLPKATNISIVTLAGINYLSFDAELNNSDLALVAQQSACWSLYELTGELLRPITLPKLTELDDDLITIPKYSGKTNEQFTKLLMNVTLSAVKRTTPQRRQILDPLSGRGTTLFTAWLAGHDSFGIETDTKSVEAMSAFLKTWLRRKKLKHTADFHPVRRDGKLISRRFDAVLNMPAQSPLNMSVFISDTTQSAKLFGRKKFDAIITDAPYGIVHASQNQPDTTKKDRSPATLLKLAIPIWATQLKQGGAMGISWNTYGLTREKLSQYLRQSGLEVCQDSPWSHFTHRVDASIKRDLIVAIKPTVK